MSKLKTFRKARKITQADIAEICGVAQNTVSNWESGRQNISQEYIKKIAEHYNINPLLLDEGYADQNGFRLISLAYNKKDGQTIHIDEYDFHTRSDELQEIINNLLLLDDEQYQIVVNAINKLLMANSTSIKLISNLIDTFIEIGNNHK